MNINILLIKINFNNRLQHLFQFVTGIFQTSGWPGVVAVIGNWFGHGKKGLIMGIWNSHTSIGNIIGATIAGNHEGLAIINIVHFK